MTNKLIVKNSVVAGKKPATAATNKPGELWVNPTDRVIGTFDAAGAPVEVGVTAATFTAGSIPFADTGGALTEDNAALFFNKTGKWLGIGTKTAPTVAGALLSVNSDAQINNVTVGAGGGGNALNTAHGLRALSKNTTAVYNSAFGTDALPNVTTGGGNTAIGAGTLKDNIIGASNTAVGVFALSAATGSNNTAIGYQSSNQLVGGRNNTSIGYASLFSNVSGTNNTAIGINSLNKALGSNNVGIGYAALRDATGGNNIAIGYQAGMSILTGSGNVLLGDWVGVDGLNNNIVVSDGSATPNVRWQVDGQGVHSWNTGAPGASTEKVRLTSPGQLLIGTTTAPTVAGALLSVNSDAQINNATLGRGKGSIASNLCFGRVSLSQVTTGAENTIFGDGAGYSVTTGNNNSAFGKGALQNLSDGSDNSAFGRNSMLGATSGSRNTSLGTISLGSLTTGSDNCAFGASALYNNRIGSNNLAFGRSALFNATGDNNICIGIQSGQTITTGSNNVILGSYAGTNTLTNNIIVSDGSSTAPNIRWQVNDQGVHTWSTGAPGASTEKMRLTTAGQLLVGTTTAPTVAGALLSVNSDVQINSMRLGYGLNANATNLALGQNALMSTTTATNNVAVGGLSLSKVTTGSNNTAIGYQTLDNTDVGSQNVAIAAGALYANKGGNGNIGIGQSALSSNISGTNNIGIGVSACFLNTVGLNNIGIGENAARQVTGSRNICIGPRAGFSLTTGDNNVIIGGYAGVAGTSGSVVLSDGAGTIRLQADANGVWNIPNATTPPTAAPSAGVSLYAKGGKLYAWAAGGAAEVALTP